MKNQIREIMSIVFGCETSDIEDGISFGSFEYWDSLAHMKLIAALEEEFEITFSDEELLEAISLALIELILERKIQV